MKLSTRKRVIQVIGSLFRVCGLVCLLLYILAGMPDFGYINLVGYAMGFLFGMLCLTTGLSILTYRKWGRILSLVLTATVVVPFLFFFISSFWHHLNPPHYEPGDYNIDISNEDGTVMTSWHIEPLYYAPNPWWVDAIVFVITLLGIYVFIIFRHRDTKLIFERKGKLEGL